MYVARAKLQCPTCPRMFEPNKIRTRCHICTGEPARAREIDIGAAAAHNAVAAAISKGLLPKAATQACVDCGKPARDYDHRDYNKPLDVQPVCRSCNLLRGPAIHLAEAA